MAIVNENEPYKSIFSMHASIIGAKFLKYTHVFRMGSFIGSLVLAPLHSGRINGVGIHVNMPILYGSVCGECKCVVIGGNIWDLGSICGCVTSATTASLPRLFPRPRPYPRPR